jgi:hypothetical protein
MPVVQILDGDSVINDTVFFDDAFWSAAEQSIRSIVYRDGAWALSVCVDPRDAGDRPDRVLASLADVDNWLATL